MKLRKRDVEAMLAGFDTDPVAALTAALRIVLERPHADWAALVSTFDDPQRSALLARDTAALDELAGELNELRDVPSALR